MTLALLSQYLLGRSDDWLEVQVADIARIALGDETTVGRVLFYRNPNDARFAARRAA